MSDAELAADVVWFNGGCVDVGEAPVGQIQELVSRGTAVHEDVSCLNESGPVVFRWGAHAARFQNNALSDHSVDAVRRAISDLAEEIAPPVTLRMVSLPSPLTGLAVLPISSVVQGRSPTVSVTVSSWRKQESSGGRISGFFRRLRAGIGGVSSEYDEKSIILTDDERLAETPADGLFLVDGETVCLASPERSVGVVPRAILEAAGRSEYSTAEISELARDDLYEADEMFLADAKSWFTPVGTVDGIDVGGMGEVSTDIEEKVQELTAGEDEWLTRV